MARLAIILAVVLFCVFTASRPDPRMQAAIEALSWNHSHETPADSEGSYYCPMDPDVRAAVPGRCARCGMTLIEGVPEILDYPLDLLIEPSMPRVAETTRLTFALSDPRSGQPVRRFETVHERLYHVFVVSQDLSFFIHTHPERGQDEDFHLDISFPKPGMYRVLSDFLPSGGTPQLTTNTVIVPGESRASPPDALSEDRTSKDTTNAHVELSIRGGRVVAGETASMFFELSPVEGVEQYLGAWGHMLAVSADLIDMVHGHPLAAADNRGRKTLQFDMTFPRPGLHRVWLQFQRRGTVNTAAFDIRVEQDGVPTS